jgi:hypothetical protein
LLFSFSKPPKILPAQNILPPKSFELIKILHAKNYFLLKLLPVITIAELLPGLYTVSFAIYG